MNEPATDQTKESSEQGPDGGAALDAGEADATSVQGAQTLAQRVVALGSPLFAGAVALASIGYFIESLSYQRGTLASPGPGLFPQIVAVALFIAAVGTIWTTRHPAPPEVAEQGASHHPLRPVTIVVGAVLFVATLSSIGFFFAGAIALCLIVVGMGVRNPFRVVLFALVLAVLSQLLFVNVLGLKFFSSVHVLGG